MSNQKRKNDAVSKSSTEEGTRSHLPHIERNTNEFLSESISSPSKRRENRSISSNVANTPNNTSLAPKALRSLRNSFLSPNSTAGNLFYLYLNQFDIKKC